MSVGLPGTDQPAVLRAASRCDAIPVFWATGRPDDADGLRAAMSAVDGPLAVWCESGAGDAIADQLVEGCAVIAAPGAVALPAGVEWIPAITGIDQLPSALVGAPDDLVLVGAESAGVVGATAAFILLQQVVAALDDGVAGSTGSRPRVWVRGGIGPDTAAAAIAGGAFGVVLDAQLALVREQRVAPKVARMLASLDGSEATVLDGPLGPTRVLVRPDVSPSTELLGFDNLASFRVPLGEDAALGAWFAEHGVTVAGAIELVRDTVESSLDLAVRQAAEVAAASGDDAEPDVGVAPAESTSDDLSGVAGSAQGPAAPAETAWNRLAGRMGTRLALLQGPMTRVSDSPAFAASVAQAGGAPFLALALLRGDEVDRLLAETAELVGDLPWGVGILGFVPPELRAEQLEVINRYRPPLAIIAGGRPSQAAALEANGTRTYLHVPSPGLLERFLADGARRFIFEGRECGGHVGPRHSFPLWQAQLSVLSGFAHPEQLDLVFAGGIHDARSAAMVRTMTAPLVDRGAAVGTLSGTAYVFCTETVNSGAVLEGFRQAAIGCEHTVLLETSPGHATRCVDSPFVRAFSERRDELVAAGVPVAERWAELEQLNLGRLRIASKGLTRADGQLVTVDESAQAAEGMFMIGDVATMRSSETELAHLHRDLTEGAAEALVARAAQLADTAGAAAAGMGPEPAPLDIAIIGMECILPGAANAAEFWTNTVTGRNAITEVDPNRWDPDRYYDPNSTVERAGERTPSKWGGFVDPVPFDPLAYGIPPSSLAAIEPVQLLSLEVASRALADAGYGRRRFDRSRTSVIFGAEAGTDLSSTYGFRSLWPSFAGSIPGELDEFLPRLTEDSFPGLLTNVIAGRIANRLDLGGVNYTVDAACASSLAALDLACKELTAHTSDMVLCGGADLHNGINDYLLFASVHALSPTGQCRTFSADADGIVLGEGVACVVLKRLADAERDGDRIYGVIKAVAGSSDGRHLGLTAPRQEGQVRALERAYERSGVHPNTVGLVEAHGTGTVVGDRTEMGTLTDLFAGHGAEPGSVVLGSVKSQIGHTKCTAGLAGLIRATFSVYSGVQPPTDNITQPNPAWDAETSPFRLDDAAAPWTSAERVAAVSAFGFGGTNFHAVLSGPPADAVPGGAARHALAAWPAELFAFYGTSWDAATAQMRNLVDYLDRHGRSAAPMRDLAATVWAKRSGQLQCALVAEDHQSLAATLSTLLAGPALTEDGFAAPARAWAPTDLGEDAKVAFLYPGQGSQRPRMLADLFVAFPALRERLVQGGQYIETMFPPTPYDPATRAAQMEAITDTRVAQPTLGIAGMAMTDLLRSLGVQPDASGGHSYGELVALWQAGALPDDQLISLSATRGEAILAAATAGAADGVELDSESSAESGDAGAMAAVSAAPSAVDELLAEWGLADAGVVVANRNSPRQSVISGPTDAVLDAIERCIAADLRATKLPVACAFHSPMVAAASDTLAEVLASVDVAAPTSAVYANATATPYTDADSVRSLLAAQVGAPVRFVEQIEQMWADGVRTFIEVGPGRVLSRLVGLILGDRPHRAIFTDVPGEPGIPAFLDAVAQMLCAGVDADLGALFDDRGRVIDIDPAAPTPSWTVDGHLVRTGNGTPVAGGLRPAIEFAKEHPMGLMTGTGGPNGGYGSGGDAEMLEYLRGMRELVAAQRDVMMTYLGATASAMPMTPMAPGSPGAVAQLDASLHRGVFEGTLVDHRAVGAEAAPANGSADGSSGGGAAAVNAAASSLTPEALEAVITSIVAERTGYPPDMLDPQLDLEADLSIDSIKRIEILGELADRVDLPGASDGEVDESVVEDLATIKTIRGIVDWIMDHADAGEDDGVVVDLGEDASGDSAVLVGKATDVAAMSDATANGAVAATSAAGSAGDPASTGENSSVPSLAICARPVWEPAPLGTDLSGVQSTLDSLVGQNVVIEVASMDDATSAIAISEAFAAAGVTAHLREAGAETAPDDDAERAAAWIDCSGRNAIELFGSLAAALKGGARVVLVVVDQLGAGVAGMIRTAAREYPEVIVRAVSGNTDSADVLAELGWPSVDEPVIEFREGVRGAIRWQRVERELSFGDDPLGLTDGVIAVTGGARGVGAKVAAGLARRYGCSIAMFGRSPMPADIPSAELAGEPDDRELRRRLIASGLSTPRQIEAAVSSLRAEADIRSTLAALSEIGVNARYLQVDATDRAAMAEAAVEIESTLGMPRLVIHSAGVLADHLIRDKTEDEFARVWSTKVDGAAALAAAFADTPTVYFASISGAVGNPGQADYSAANDVLDALARSAPHPVLAVDWGPWGGGGMVSAELEREYERRGVGLLDPEDALEFLCTQLDAGLPERQLMLVRADPAAIGAFEAKAASATESDGDNELGEAGIGADTSNDDAQAGMPAVGIGGVDGDAAVAGGGDSVDLRPGDAGAAGGSAVADEGGDEAGGLMGVSVDDESLIDLDPEQSAAR